MAARKKDGEAAERAPKTLTQRAVAIVKILDTCAPEERARVMIAVEALSGAPKVQTSLSLKDADNG